MKRNLFAAFLAVMLVMALVFVVAPGTKATTGADHTFTADGQSYEVKGNCVIDLAGFDVSITVAEGVENPNVVVIDSKNLEDMTGNSAGTLAVNGTCTINDVNLNLVDSYRYLKVDNGGTYSFYPFNMAITKSGIHVKANAVALEVRFVANKVVQDKLTAYGLYNHSGEHAGLMTDVKKSGYVFAEGKYGLRVCFNLTGSLAEEMLNETRTFSAYVEIDGTPIIGNQRVDVTSADILAKVNAAYSSYKGEARNLAKLLYLNNADLRVKYLSNFTNAITEGYMLVTKASDLKAGDKIIIVAKDYNYALSTTQNTNNRGKVAITKGNSTVTFAEGVQILTLEEGTAPGTFAFNTGSGYLYAASSDSNHLKTQTTNNDNSSWQITIDAEGIATIKAQGDQTRNWLRYNNSSSIFSCYGSGQQDVVIYKLGQIVKCDHDVAETNPTCDKEGKCALCGNAIAALGHNFPATGSHQCTNAGCEETSEHNYVDGICTICGGSEPTTDPENPGTVDPSWTKTDLNDIKSTDIVVIVWTTSTGKSYAISNNNGTAKAPSAVAVTVDGNTLTGDIVETIKWNITNSNGSLTIYPDGTTATWLYCTSTNNGVRVGTNANKAFTIDSSSGYLKHTSTSRYLGVYTTTPDVRCYTSSTATNIKNQTLAFYVYNSGTAGGETPDTPVDPPVEEPTEAPTETPTEAPTEAPTETPEPETPETPSVETITVSKTHTALVTGAGLSTTDGTKVNKTFAMDSNISVAFAKGTSTSDPVYYAGGIRLYQGGATMTVTASNGYKIKTIVITLQQNTAGDGPIAVAGGTADNASAPTNYVYTITANADTSTIVITTKGTDKNSRLYVANIEVIYEK